MGAWGLQAPLRRQETMERLPWQPGAASPGASRLKLGGGVLRKGGWERGAAGADLGAACPPHPHPQEGLQGLLSGEEESSLCGPILQSLRGETRENGFRQATWETLD